jgi:hypothetical protein
MTFQTNFSAGQIDPRMLGREDIGIFGNSAQDLTNNAPLVQGGVARRPGTDYLATLTATTRLERFRFSKTQLYVFAFSNAELKIYNAAGSLLQTLSTQPWNATTMWEMRLTTSGDTTIIVHEDFSMKSLLRTGASTFTITDFAFESHSTGYPRYEPYYKFAADGNTLASSATTGTVTLTSSAAHFSSGHVGSIVRYKGKECDVTAYLTTTTVTAEVRETLSGTSADDDWDENVFSAINGYARSVAFHPRRLWFGGSRDLPNFMFSSHSNGFFNFSVGTAQDDESIQGSLGLDEVNNILHLVSSRHLQVFTDAGVLYIRESDTQPITPANYDPNFTVPYGVSDVATPRRYDGATLFVQDTGKVVRELLWNDLQDSYTAAPISLLASDIISGVQQLSIFFGNTTGPEQWATMVNDDGTIAIYHSVRSEKIAAWIPWTTDGTFESITELNGIIYTSVKRNINGSDVYYLEKFNFDRTVDCAASLGAVSGTTWSGLAHLEAESASVIDGNLYHGPFTVNSSGQVVLNEAASAPEAGLNFTRTIIDLPPVIAGPNGSTHGLKKRVGTVVIRVHEAVNFTVAGQEFLIRQVDDALEADPTPVSNQYEFHTLGWTRTGEITITQTAPLKCTVLSIWKEVLV